MLPFRSLASIKVPMHIAVDAHKNSPAAHPSLTIATQAGNDTDKTHKSKLDKENGWRGVVALVMGVAGFLTFSFFWFAWVPTVLAIVMGIGGLRHRRRNKALAALGLALGAFVACLWFVVVL